MPGITVKGMDSAGGTQIGGSGAPWTVDGQPIVLLGDPVAGHGKSPHDAPVMVQGSSWFTLDGVPVCHAGHLASCGHGATGRDWFDIE